MQITELIGFSLPKNKYIQLFRFIIIGGLTASLDFALLITLTDIFRINYLVSAAISFLAGSSINYLLSIKWVFWSGKFNSSKVEFGVFLLFTMFGLIINQLIMYLFTELVALKYFYSKVISLIVVTMFNFLTKKYIVFIK